MSNPVAQQIPRTRFPEKLGFCTFSTASNVVYQFKSIYYLFFLTNVLKIDILTAGTILTLGTIWDAVNDPLIGFWAVNHKFKNGEHVRPLAIWFAVPWAITVVLLFTDFGLPNKAAIAVALIVYLFFELFNTFVGIPYNSMGSLATNLDADRRSINVFRNLGGALGKGGGAFAQGSERIALKASRHGVSAVDRHNARVHGKALTKLVKLAVNDQTGTGLAAKLTRGGKVERLTAAALQLPGSCHGHGTHAVLPQLIGDHLRQVL